jgi:hypothetical protein
MAINAQSRSVDTETPQHDHPAWMKAIIGQMVVSQEVAACAKAYADLKDAMAEQASAERGLKDIPAWDKPVDETQRNSEILSVAGTELAEATIREHAQRDAANKRVQMAQEKVQACMSETARSYDVLVRTLAKRP